MAERDKAEFERSLATTRRDAAEGLIDSMLFDMKMRLVQIGRPDLLPAPGNQIPHYYRTLEAIPGGMPQSDFARMAIAAELVGLAGRDSGNPDGALAIWGEVREKTAALVGKDTSPTTRGARMMIARLDFQIGTVSQARGKMAHAIEIYRKAKDEFAALIVEAPRDRQILLYSAENHDRLGDILRNEGKLDTAMEEYTEAKSERTVAKPAARMRPASASWKARPQSPSFGASSMLARLTHLPSGRATPVVGTAAARGV
jgi:tetratricopeptide (TPR) repeat protein